MSWWQIRTGAIAGLLCSAAAAGVLLLLDRLQLTPFVPFNVANAVIRWTPGDVATTTIETIGAWGKRLVIAGSVAGFLCSGAVVGVGCVLLMPRGNRPISNRRWVVLGTVASLVMLALTLLLQYSVPANRTPLVMSLRSPVLMALVYLFSCTGTAWIVNVIDSYPNRSSTTILVQRRNFVLRSGGTLLALAVSSSAISRLLPSKTPGVAGKALPSGPPLEKVPSPAPSTQALVVATNSPTLTVSSTSTTAPALPLTSDQTSTMVPRATATPSRPATPTRTPVSSSPTSVPAFAMAPGTRPEITTQNTLYLVASGTVDPVIEPAQWRLSIGGAVRQPFSLTYADLLELPRHDQTSTLTCISNEVGGNLIGNCNWNGVLLRDLLARAGVLAAATKVVFRGAEGYSDSLPLAAALEASTLVAYGIDGNALEVGHGFPARLHVPGRYGIKNVKWLTAIEVITGEYQGYWQQRGWSEPAVVETTAAIDTGNPRRGAYLKQEQGLVRLGGIAFAGIRGISKVELQVSDGEWREVELKPNPSPYSWRLWRYDWGVLPGKYRLAVRATDGQGQLQTMRLRAPHPEGATGYHSVDVVVS